MHTHSSVPSPHDSSQPGGLAAPLKTNMRAKYTFLHPWFEHHLEDWERITQPLRGQKLNILEIGSFEGASTTWMLDNLMQHPESALTAIDTFAGGLDQQLDQSKKDYGLASLEQRFMHNVGLSDGHERLSIKKNNSLDAAIELRHAGASFDFIYIDGSHVAYDVLHDATVCWPMLKPYGTIVFDDFLWNEYKHECHNPQIAIVSFLRCVASTSQSFHCNGQVWVKKVPEHIPAVHR